MGGYGVMKPRKLSRVIALLLFLCVLSGCAAFRDGKLQRVTPWPPEPAPAKKTIHLLVTGKAVVNGEEKPVQQGTIKAWEAETAKAYMESGIFSEVKILSSDADVHAEVSYLDKGEGSQVWAFISGFTMLMLPFRGTEEFTVTTTFKDRKRKVLGSVEKTEGASFWFQLLLVLAMPTNSVGSVFEEILLDLNRSTLKDARAKGWLY